MMQSKTRLPLKLVNQVAGHAPNCPLNGRMQSLQRAHAQARRCRTASVAVMARFHLRHVAKAGRRKTVVVPHVRVVKKRWALAVVKRRTASLQRHRVGALRMVMAHRVAVLVVAVVTPEAATQAVVQGSATRPEAVPGHRVAHHAAVAAMAATRPLAVQATAVAVTTVTAAAQVARATQAVAVVTTGAAPVAVKAAAMVAATKVVPAPVRRARAGVIAVSRHLTDAAVAARVAEVMAAATVVAQVAMEIAAVVVAAADSRATVARLLRVAASALAVAQAIAMA